MGLRGLVWMISIVYFILLFGVWLGWLLLVACVVFECVDLFD